MITDNALEILKSRYFLADKDGNSIEDWDGLCRRVADYIAMDEKPKNRKKWAQKYYDLIYNLKFIPNSPALMNAGTKNPMCSACFVIGIEDDMNSIMDAVKNFAMIHKMGGGVGASFSKIRPEGSFVGDSAGQASGPVSFIRMINAVTNEVKQGNRRRGANMASLSCHHPDILKFIECKKDTSQITNFNISVEITDAFMEALKSGGEYDIIDPRTGKIYVQDGKEIRYKAKDVFDKIVKNAWETGEPGLLFIDRINNLNEYGRINSANPCIKGDSNIAIVGNKATIKQIADGDIYEPLVYCWDMENNIPCISKMSKAELTIENAVTLNITFHSGFSVVCTLDHNFYTIHNNRIKARDLKVGSKVLGIMWNKSLRAYAPCYYKVSRVKRNGKCDVYNGTVDKYHNYVIVEKETDKALLGVISSNCGEEPLRDGESCLLGSVNLSKYVVNDEFDFATLKNDVRIATRFLDSMISMNKYPLEEIDRLTKETRKIGIGIMGLADAFALLGIVYGSNESYEFAEKMMSAIHNTALDESRNLGKEKGLCEAAKKLKLKRRNLWVTSIAPTGSISIFANASSGCEPFFSSAYQRKVTGSKDMIFVSDVFKKLCEKYNFKITKSIEEKLISTRSIQGIKEIPEEIRKVFITADDLAPEQHVKMQACLQKYVSAGVSKTINMQNSAKVEDVKKSYLLAYELGCKGITVYRDGSRPMQVISVKKEEKTGVKAVNRKKITIGVTEKINTPLGKLYLTVNRNEENSDPIEVFVQIGKSGSDIKAYNESIGRLISLCYKYQIPTKEICKQLKGIKSEERIFCDGQKYDSIIDLLGKKLEEYSKEKVIERVKCPECGSVLMLEEGCLKCPCGFSKC